MQILSNLKRWTRLKKHAVEKSHTNATNWCRFYSLERWMVFSSFTIRMQLVFLSHISLKTKRYNWWQLCCGAIWLKGKGIKISEIAAKLNQRLRSWAIFSDMTWKGRDIENGWKVCIFFITRDSRDWNKAFHPVQPLLSEFSEIEFRVPRDKILEFPKIKSKR